MAKQLRGGRQRALGPRPCTAPVPAPRSSQAWRRNGGVTNRKKEKRKKRVLAGSGMKRERVGMEGVEWHRKTGEGRVEAANGEDMMVHKSPVAD